MNNFNSTIKLILIAVIAIILTASPVLGRKYYNRGYEIWGSDQSNSVANVESRGVNGSLLWV